MENTKEDALFRARSPRSCVRLGCQLYLSNFRRLAKATCLPAAVFAIAYSVLATIMVIQFPRLNITSMVNPETAYQHLSDYIALALVALVAIVVGGLAEVGSYGTTFKMLDEHRATGAIAHQCRWLYVSRRWSWRCFKGALSSLAVALLLAVVCGMAVAGIAVGINKMGGQELLGNAFVVALSAVVTLFIITPLLYMFTSYMLNDKQAYWPHAFRSFSIGMRHFGLLFVATLITVVFAGIVAIVISMPAVIVGLANAVANTGLLYGDPLGMPSYITLLTAIAMAFAGFVALMCRCLVMFVFYFAYGSICALEEEKKKFNSETQNP